jgi:hypothetical protein
MSSLIWALILLSALQPASLDSGMELSFPRVAVKPGETAALPIYLVSSGNYHEPFRITLEFQKGELTFQKIERAYLAERAKWIIAAAVKAHAEKEELNILQIDITPGQASFFPSGAVAHAHFTVAADRPAGDIVLASALVAPVGAPPVPPTDAAKITVFTTPIFGCFFYMH